MMKQIYLFHQFFYISGLGASMYMVESLLKDLIKHFGKSIECISVDSPGYGFSEPPKSWENESPDTEIQLLHNIIEKIKYT